MLNLSGGNQQKVVIARWVETGMRLLVLEEPTFGVDVGAKAEIYRILDRLVGEGRAVLLISSDFEEVAGIAHQALVLDRGQITAEVPRERLSVPLLTPSRRRRGAGRRRRMKQQSGLLRFLSVWHLLVLLVALLVLFTVIKPDTFPTAFTFKSMASSRSINAMMALAVMIPLACNQFDLSAASVVGIGQVLANGLQTQQGLSWPVACAIVLAMGALVGLVNGLLVTRARINSFIATLGTGTLLLGVNQSVHGRPPGRWPPARGLHRARRRRAGHRRAPAAALCAGDRVPALDRLRPSPARPLPLRDRRQPAGRRALGHPGRPLCRARLRGLRRHRRHRRHRAAGAARVGPGTVGQELLLPAFTGALLGATAIRPGRPNPWGTVLAVAVLAVAVAGLSQLGAPFYVEPIFNRAMLILAVGLAAWMTRRREQRLAAAEAERRRATGPPPEAGEVGHALTLGDGLRLDGRRVLVTGAAAGIGEATARLLASLGATVLLADRDDTASLARELRGSAFRVDLASAEALDELVAAAGPVDALVANAAICPFDDWREAGWDAVFDKVIRTDLLAPIRLARALLPGMAARGGGRMVFVGSLAGKTGGLIASPHYVAAKGGLHAFVRWLARQAAPQGVIVNGVAGLDQDTPHGGPAGEHWRHPDRAARRAGRGRLAHRLSLLAGGGYVCGAVLDVNGGVRMGRLSRRGRQGPAAVGGGAQIGSAGRVAATARAPALPNRADGRTALAAGGRLGRRHANGELEARIAVLEAQLAADAECERPHQPQPHPPEACSRRPGSRRHAATIVLDLDDEAGPRRSRARTTTLPESVARPGSAARKAWRATLVTASCTSRPSDCARLPSSGSLATSSSRAIAPSSGAMIAVAESRMSVPASTSPPDPRMFRRRWSWASRSTRSARPCSRSLVSAASALLASRLKRPCIVCSRLSVRCRSSLSSNEPGSSTGRSSVSTRPFRIPLDLRMLPPGPADPALASRGGRRVPMLASHERNSWSLTNVARIARLGPALVRPGVRRGWETKHWRSSSRSAPPRPASAARCAPCRSSAA
ncbi:MAG: SDR family NAD(P)-dependent oxidoreductase [Geminicoccaceae bacterium]